MASRNGSARVAPFLSVRFALAMIDLRSACGLLVRPSPLLARRGGCTIKKRREASLVRADGVVVQVQIHFRLILNHHPGLRPPLLVPGVAICPSFNSPSEPASRNSDSSQSPTRSPTSDNLARRHRGRLFSLPANRNAPASCPTIRHQLLGHGTRKLLRIIQQQRPQPHQAVDLLPTHGYAARIHFLPGLVVGSPSPDDVEILQRKPQRIDRRMTAIARSDCSDVPPAGRESISSRLPACRRYSYPHPEAAVESAAP